MEGFTIVYDALIQKYGLYAALVFGKISRYESMKNGVCSASQPKMAQELGISAKTVSRAIQTLVSEKLVFDISPTKSYKKGMTRQYKTNQKQLSILISMDSQSIPNDDAPEAKPASNEENDNSMDSESIGTDSQSWGMDYESNGIDSQSVGMDSQSESMDSQSNKEYYKNSINNTIKNTINNTNKILIKGYEDNENLFSNSNEIQKDSREYYDRQNLENQLYGYSVWECEFLNQFMMRMFESLEDVATFKEMQGRKSAPWFMEQIKRQGSYRNSMEYIKKQMEEFDQHPELEPDCPREESDLPF